MKSCFASCLRLGAVGALLLSSQVQAASPGWSRITRGEDGSNYLAHATSIRTEGRMTRIWVMTELGKPNRLAGQEYVSTKTLYAVDCGRSTMARVSHTAYSLPSGSGDVVQSLSFEPYQQLFEPVLPDTVGSSIAEYACDPRVRATRAMDDLAAAAPPPTDKKPTAEVQAELDLLDRSYPTWFEHTESPEFKRWITAQSRSLQDQFKSAKTAATLMDVINTHRKSQGLPAIPLVAH